MEPSEIVVVVYYATVKRVLEFYYYTCQTVRVNFNNDTRSRYVKEFVDVWKQKAESIIESMYRQTSSQAADRYWQSANSQREKFEEDLCDAIEANKNLLPPHSFDCDQFNGLLGSIGVEWGLRMPPRWHVSILKIVAVIADQQAERAEEELSRQMWRQTQTGRGPTTTRNESPQVARPGNGGSLRNRMDTQIPVATGDGRQRPAAPSVAASPGPHNSSPETEQQRIDDETWSMRMRGR